MINFKSSEFTEEQIIKMYLQSKNKREQIKIIADLLVTNTDEVKSFLENHNINLNAPVVNEKKVKKGKANMTRVWTPEKIEMLKKGYADGVDRQELAKSLGVDSKAVQNKAWALELNKTAVPVKRAQKQTLKAPITPIQTAPATIEKLIHSEISDISIIIETATKGFSGMKAYLIGRIIEAIIDDRENSKEFLLKLWNITRNE